MASEDVALEEETFTAAEWVAREEALDVEAASRASQKCTYSRATVAEAIAGVSGVHGAVFSCRTCAAAGGGAPVGVCEACMLHCHDEHEIVEVGERGFFRCDCPTIRSSVECKTQPPGIPTSSLPPNVDNTYGHNFEGRFCR